MATSFVQLNPDVDATGKQLDNDVVVVPVGTVVTDNFGNQTVLQAPGYYFRERVVVSDPGNPSGVATVTANDGPRQTSFGLTVRVPPLQSDFQDILATLLSIDANIASMFGGESHDPDFQYIDPTQGIPPGIPSKDVPRRVIGDIFGRQITVPYSSRESQGSSSVTITSSTASQTLVPAFQNQYTDLVSIIAINTSGSATELDISDGTQTIPLYIPAGDMRGISLGGVLIKATTPNTVWTATTLTSVASVKVWTNYVQNRQI